MSDEKDGLLFNLKNLLQQDYRGVNIAVYAVATTGLGFAIHRIRPVSKFSKATQIPDHFIRQHEPLKGVYAGVKHSPVRMLVNHKAPIYLPLWHSSKPPLPVKLYGVNIVSGNAINWLECVAAGKNVTLKPIERDNDNLVSNVLLHLHNQKTIETLDVGKTLVELGFAKVSVPENIQKNSLESQLARLLQSAEKHAKSYRKGIWADTLPPLPFYIVYWRKSSQVAANLIALTLRKTLEILSVASRSALIGLKKLALKPFRTTPKQIHTT